MGLAVTMFYSCKKDKQIVNNEQSPEYTAKALNIWHKLVYFNEKIKSGARDNELIPSDSAIWYLETLLNVQQAVDTAFNDSYMYEENYTIEVNENGLVNMNDVTTLYNQMVSDIEDELDQVESDYKFLIIVILEEQPSRDGNINIKFGGVIAQGRFSTYTPFTDDDDWYYGNMLGREDGEYEHESDAGQQLKYRINNQGIKPTFTYNTWINPDQTINLYASNTQNRLYYEEAGSAPIINDTDMLMYLTNMHYLVYNDETDLIYGYFLTTYGSEIYFKLMNLWTNVEPSPDGKYWHKVNFIYAEPIYIPIIE